MSVTTTVFSNYRIPAALLTLLAIVLQPLLPLTSLTVMPNDMVYPTLYSPAESPDAATWVDQEKGIWRCNFQQSDPYSCGVAIGTSQNTLKGIDLSKFDELHTDLRFTGSDRRLRMYLRNLDLHDKNRDDLDSAKLMSISARQKDLSSNTVIKLTDFRVNEWWINSRDTHWNDTQPSFENIIGIGIDFIVPGDYEISLTKIEFKGSLIAKDTFYLTIIALWMLAFALEGLTYWFRAHRERLYNRQRLAKLNEHYEQIKQEKQKFEYLSITDDLTQTLNRGGINQAAKIMFAQVHERSDIGLILIDIDHFKQVNDTRGHDCGDRILAQTAHIIQGATRENDIFGRWGGEEFLLIFPNATPQNVIALAEKLRSTIAEQVFEAQNPLHVTISLGATIARSEDTFNIAFKQADEALYKAKSSGRNQVVFDG